MEKFLHSFRHIHHHGLCMKVYHFYDKCYVFVYKIMQKIIQKKYKTKVFNEKNIIEKFILVFWKPSHQILIQYDHI